MNLRSLILPALVLVPMLQLSGCVSVSTTSRPPVGGTYLSRSAGANFDQSAQLTDDGGYISKYTFQDLHRPQYDLNRIYLAADTHGVVYSLDDGEIWHQVDTGLKQTLSVVSLTADIMAVAGLDSNGQGYIRRTSDNGVNWETVLTVPRIQGRSLGVVGGSSSSQAIIINMAADPFQPERLYAGTSLGNILVGEQYGKTWTNAYTLGSDIYSTDNFYIRQIIPSPHTPNEVILLTSNNRLYQVSDSTQSEIEVSFTGDSILPYSTNNSRYSLRSVKFVTGYPDAMFVGLSDGAAISRDRGLTWERLPLPADTSLPFGSSVIESSPTNPARLLVALNDVVYRSEDGGTNWYSADLGLADRVIVFLSINPSNPSRVLAVTNPNS